MARILWPGNAGPLARTPPRAPVSVRRTATIDGRRPQGFSGPVVLEARGRDLATGPDGSARAVDEAEVVVETDSGWDVEALHAVPPEPALAALVGSSARFGFRRAAYQ